jgi:hypothetical protein
MNANPATRKRILGGEVDNIGCVTNFSGVEEARSERALDWYLSKTGAEQADFEFRTDFCRYGGRFFME